MSAGASPDGRHQVSSVTCVWARGESCVPVVAPSLISIGSQAINKKCIRGQTPQSQQGAGNWRPDHSPRSRHSATASLPMVGCQRRRNS